MFPLSTMYLLSFGTDPTVSGIFCFLFYNFTHIHIIKYHFANQHIMKLVISNLHILQFCYFLFVIYSEYYSVCLIITYIQSKHAVSKSNRPTIYLRNDRAFELSGKNGANNYYEWTMILFELSEISTSTIS
jgi:hypothetical protein